MKKKLVSVLLSVALVATLMIGCGKEEVAEAPVEEVTTEAVEEVAEEPVAEVVEEPVVEEVAEEVAAVAGEEVPAATYEYLFDGDLGGAVTAVRVGDLDGLPPTPVYPTQDDSIVVAYEEGVHGQAITLDSSFGLILDAQPVGEDYTLAFWVKAERFSNFGPIIQIGSDLLSANVASTWLNITKTDWDGDMAPVIWSRNEVDATWPWFACGSNYVINKKEWVHIAVTVSGSTPVVGPEDGLNYAAGKVYVNGALMGEGTVALGTFAKEGSQAFVGINCWDSIFKGAFDDIKIFDSVLTDGQIVTLATK